MKVPSGLVFAGTLAVASLLRPVHVLAVPGETLASALEFAGFDLLGNHNPLSGGIDFLVRNEFDASAPFDFGSWNLALDGPISMQVSTGGRLISQFNFSLSTALSAGDTPSPLSYASVFDIGAQSREVTGSLLSDFNFSMNELGYYDLSVTYSSRRTVETSGLVSNDSSTHDVDLGPIQVSGNIYADVLAVLTDPFFDRAGRPNFFLTLSGNTLLSDALNGAAGEAQSSLASGLDGSGATVYRTVAMSFGNGTLPPGQGIGRGNGMGGGSGILSGGAVPEPTVLLLLLLGVPAVLSHVRKA